MKKYKKRYYLDRIGADYIQDKKSTTFRYRLSRLFSLKAWQQNHKYNKLYHKLGFDARECWNMDIEFFNWVYEHICCFLDDHGPVDIEDKTYFNFEDMDLKQTLEKLKFLIERYLLLEKEDDIDVDYTINEDGLLEFKQNEEFKEHLRKQNLAHQMLYDAIFYVLKAALPYIWW